MMPEAERSLEKADQCLTTARAELAINLSSEAGRNAYLAAFHSARAFIFERTDLMSPQVGAIGVSMILTTESFLSGTVLHLRRRLRRKSSLPQPRSHSCFSGSGVFSALLLLFYCVSTRDQYPALQLTALKRAGSKIASKDEGLSSYLSSGPRIPGP
jgi:hypothetical protein